MTNKHFDDALPEDALQIMAEGVAPANLNSQAKSRIKQRIAQRLSGECPEGGNTVPASINEWFALNEHICIKILHQDHENRVQTALWRLKPGAVITSHRHNHDEECLVLEGAIKVGEHSLEAGDFHHMQQGSYHPDITSDTGALLYLKHDMHERLMGPAAHP